MTIWFKHVHRLKQFKKNCVAHLPNKRDIETKFPISYFGHVQNKKYGNFVPISRLTGKCATQKLKKPFAVVLVHGHVYHMVILRSQNKITDFFDDFSLIVSFNKKCHVVRNCGIAAKRPRVVPSPTLHKVTFNLSIFTLTTPKYILQTMESRGFLN